MYRRQEVVDMVHPERAGEGTGEAQARWVLVQPQGM
jgi:hypothetical protein